MTEIIVKPGTEIELGRWDENLAYCVVFDISHWQKTYGDGTVQLLHQRCGDSSPYPCVVSVDGSKVKWGITEVDVASPGRGNAELRYYVGETRVKSEIYHTRTKQSMGNAGATPDDPQQSWVDQVLEQGAAVLEAERRTRVLAGQVEDNARQAGENAKQAQAAMTAAQQAQEAAQKNEEASSFNASVAAVSKQNALTSAQQASTSATQAEASKTAAQSSATTATQRAVAAETYAEAAAASAEEAEQSAKSVNADEWNARIAAKGDNLEFDNEEGLLYLTSGGERIGDGIKVATSGGGGGGGESNNAVLTVKNTAGWIYKTISSGAACPISLEWSSIEEGMATGKGVLKITVNGTTKHTVQVEQGEVSLDIGPWLVAGSCVVKANITDAYGNSRSLIYNITVVSLLLESSFNATVPYTGEIPYPYTPTGSAEKNVYFIMDGTQIGTATVAASGRQQTFIIPSQTHGSHIFEVYFTAVVDGETVPSNRLRYDLICTEDGNTTPIIASTFNQNTAEQYDNLSIEYIVYNPASLTSSVSLLANGVAVGPNLTVDRTVQTWSYRPNDYGALTLEIVVEGAQPKTFELTVTESSIDVEAETENLSLHLTSYGRSNTEPNPGEWKYANVSANLTGFNFTSDGWMQDEDGITVLRVGGDARVEIPVQVFAKDFRTTGKTIEIEFASRNVLAYDAILATCWSGERGIQITAQQAMLKSEQSEVTTRYKEDDHLRLSFVIEKRSKNRLILGYINGIISGMLQYPDDDDFSQNAPVTVSVGSNDCTIDIYNIRIYENDLTRFQMLDNWIADTQNPVERRDRYDRNNIFDEYGQILPKTLRPNQHYMVINCPVLPTFKGDKKTCSGYYVDPVNPERSFEFEGAEIDVQGTSSQYYYVKNFTNKFKGGFTKDGQTSPTYAMNDNAVPTNEFTFKADVASSEGANNVVLAELYNDLCPVKTPAQEDDPRVRQTIEGHPIVMFHDDGSGAKFIGKYNFNNDKGTPEVFGFVPGDESWEIKENGNALVSFKTDDFTNWQTSFEARYPEDNTDITKLRQFVSWVASTDTTAAGLTESQKESRLDKFKNEISNWASVDDAVFYYLFTLFFLCIDQREKNAFPTWNAELAKWLWYFYDADSSIGTDNKGNLTFEYWMEDIDFTEAGDPVFNGQNNVFWTNLRLCFADKIKEEYQRLRTERRENGEPLLSYEVVDRLFAEHQSQWPEAIYNEDAWRKAVEPLEKLNDALYLPMQQGKKEQHFKHWMYNRFRYMDSKFETGSAMSDRIAARAHAQGNIFLTSYINMYGQVYYNDQLSEHRMFRDREYEFEWTAQGAEDAVIGINNAAMITSLGDLSALMLEYIDISKALHLTHLKVGDSAEGYVNDNFTRLTLGNNVLLKTLDVRNCTKLGTGDQKAVDVSGCTNIEQVYFDNTAITGLTLPNGGIVKTLHLPGTMTNLTIRNQTAITEFVMPSYANITTLRLENVSTAVPVKDIFDAIPVNSRVRLIGFDWNFDSAADILALCDRLDTMRGLDEQGNNVDKAQMSGTVRVDNITGSQLATIRERYPDIHVVYQTLVSYLYFYDEMGENVLQILEVKNGGDGVYTGTTPTKESTAQYEYTHAGWSLTPGGEADPDALLNVETDRSVYAVFTATVRTYTVRFFNESVLYHTVENVPYGGSATPPADPVKEGGWKFTGWEPEPTNITGDTDCYAQFRSTAVVSRKLIDRSISGEYVNDRVTSIGNNAFYFCFALTTADFPAATSIGNSAFYSCSALTTADFPAATSIGNSVFISCSKLTALILRNTAGVCTLSNTSALSGTPIKSGTGYIYVPSALVNSYKSATNWSTYANQFRALEDYTVDGTITGELDPTKIAA